MIDRSKLQAAMAAKKRERFEVIHGDCLDALRAMSPASVSSLVTDPPAGISFMGKAWDDDKGGRDQWIIWLTDVMREALRVMKPGAHGLVWAIPRTAHWTMAALENAGFEIRDVVTHLFGTGFPKSLDVSKAIDKEAGAERVNTTLRGKSGPDDGRQSINPGLAGEYFNSDPVTATATAWSGWGTALKPAAEFWVLVRKPCDGDTVAENVLAHGTGALNIDGCRISISNGEKNPTGSGIPSRGAVNFLGNSKGIAQITSDMGRFPANLVLSHNPDCELSPHVFPDGSTAPQCSDGCAVAALDQQSGELTIGANPTRRIASLGFGGSDGQQECPAPRGIDKGGASRFFYVAKASKADKQKGIERHLSWENADQNLAVPMAAASRLLRDISGDGTLALDANEWSTALFGSLPSDQSQTDLISIIKMVSKLTTEFRISNASPSSNTNESILDAIRTVEENGLSLAKAAEQLNLLKPNITNEKTASAMNAVHAALAALLAIRRLAKTGNVHATPKNTALMRYLIRLVTPPGGCVLDPFAGSGSIGVAALREGMLYRGVEKEAQYLEIARRRCANYFAESEE